MRVVLRFNDGMVQYTTSPSKRKMSGFISRLSEKQGVFEGSCRVTYKPGYYNEIEFNSIDDLKHKLWPCLERELANEFAA